MRWTVQELKSSWELAAEGTALNHCVVSYSDQCADGRYMQLLNRSDHILRLWMERERLRQDD